MICGRDFLRTTTVATLFARIQQLHGEAIAAVASALHDPEESLKDETVLAVLLLQMAEVSSLPCFVRR